MKATVLIAALTGMPGLALAEDIATQSYVCDRGAVVVATYLNIGARSLAVVTAEGRQMAFEVAISASGARYVAVDAAQPYVWWTKGDTASLSYGPASDEVVIYTACKVQTAP